MATPDQLASLEGQQYLVLRPAGSVGATYDELQQSAVEVFGADIRRPHTGHVTLRAFFEPQRRDEISEILRDWGKTQSPIELRAEAVDSFPTPWQVLILRAARTGSLVGAYSKLTALLEPTDLQRLDERSVEDWTFHLSLLYGRRLEADLWRELSSQVVAELPEQPHELIAEAELVWYESGIEHAELIPLLG